MSRNSIADPEKFELASIVTKNSRTGITSNRRLLVARSGHLYYYSNIPKAFTGDNIKVLEQFHELPKCSIEIINIIKINGFQPSSSYFSIQFQAKHMLQREDIRRTLLNEDFNFTPRNTKQLVTWQFTCDNQFIKQRWVSALTHLKEYHKNQQLNMQKYFDSINNPPHSNEEIKSSNGSYSSRGSLKISPWRESVASRKSYTVDSNKYGFEFREGSPKDGSNKLEDNNSWLKKGKSEDSKNFPQFQMIIEPNQIENALKLQPTKLAKAESPKKTEQPSKQLPPKQSIIHPQTIIQQVSQQPSINQTPIKQNSMSDSQDHLQRRQSMERTLNELKLYSQTHSYKPILPPNQQLNPSHQLSVPNLYIVEEKPQLKSSKISGENSHTSRSLEAKAYSQKQNSSSRVFSIGCEFQWLFGESYKSDLKFDEKMQKQKQLIIYVQNFKQKACGALASFIEGKARNQHRFPVSEQPNHTVLVEVGNIKLKIAYVRTQNIQINGKNKIFFNEDSVKNLKRQFKIYQNLFRLIVKKLKSQHTFNIRIPLTIYIQCKGVSCIAFDQISSYESIDLADDDDWPIQKNILTEEGYKLEWFNFKRTGQFLSLYVKTRGKNIDKDDENLKEYFKKIIKVSSEPKNHNIIFDSPIDKAFLEMAAKQNASTSLESLQKYVKGLKNIKTLSGTCPKQEIITALQYCIYSKYLRKIYRSAQGEIDETHFFNLVFKKDSSMMTLLQQSNCPTLASIRGQLFSFIEYYFGVILEIDQKHFKVYQQDLSSPDKKKKKDLFFSTTTIPICREYPFSSLEIVQSYAKLGQYLQNRHYLAQAALSKKKQIYHLSSQNLTLSQSLELLYDEASYSFLEHDLVSCIRKCKEYQQICPHQYTKLFSIYLLMLKAYSQFSQNDFSITLKKATELIEYNYGNDHSSLISLFSLAAFYYSKLSHKPNAKKESNLIAIATKLLKKAEQLCSKHFGINSNQYLDIVVDLARLYRQIDVVAAQKYVDHAQKICHENQTLAVPENIVSILIFQIQLNLQIGNLSEAETYLFQALNFIDSKVTMKTKKHLLKIQYELGFYMQKYKYCEEAVEHLWQMGNNEKIEAIELAYKAAIRQSGISQTDSLIDQNDSVRFQGRPKTLLFIEQSKKQHESLIELIASAIQGKNTKLLTMIYFLNRV